jgi:small subunit ribosomal protein S1
LPEYPTEDFNVTEEQINQGEELQQNATPATTELPVEIETAHDDFDWTVGKRSQTFYTKEEKAQFESLYENTLKTLNDNEIVQGQIVGITATDVVLNVGFKSDGLVSLSEFRDMESIKVGDNIDVFVESKEDAKGHLVLSRKKAKLAKAWEQIVDAYKNETIVTGNITSKTKGGLIVEVFGLETFLPGSQIDVKPITDYDAFVGKRMEFKVVKINEAIKNAVVSHKALIESDIEAQRSVIMGKMEKGQVLEGTIKNITDFGAFIDLGGVDGLLYITDISWGRINHPSEVLQLNQKLNVVVLEFDDEKKRISLGLKQLQPHPWETLTTDFQVGSKVTGKIVNIEDYGAFLEIQPGVEGLIHVSEVTWSNTPVNSKEFFKLGDTMEAVVMTVDREERKMSLSLKRLLPDPWEKITEKFPVGSKYTGKVANITPYGVFVELEDGIGGMVHISDLSWTKRFNHPSEFTKTGNDLDVVILNIDLNDRKLTLGHKQIEEDPWDTFETIFQEGSLHEGTIIRKEENGGIVSLPYGLEGFAPAKHLYKEDGKQAGADETLTFKVIEFDRKDKKLIVSHIRVWEEVKREQEGAEKQEKVKERKKTKDAVKTVNKQVEKTTLGDLGVLGNLKEQLEKSEKGASKSAEKKEEPKVSKTSIEQIEGIGDAYKQKLEDAGIKTVEELLEAGATKKGRTELAEKTEISETLILKWVNHADLFRIKGVAGQYAELLEAAGVDTIKELRNRNAENLAAKMAEVNADKNLSGSVPSQSSIEGWIEEAKTLEPKVSH